MSVEPLPTYIKNDIVQELIDKGCSCIVYSQSEKHYFYNHGVKDLFFLLNDSPDVMYNAFITDKVIGKGAAALMCAGKVADVYAVTISQPALELLKIHGINVEYGQCVAHIINRTGTDLCPVEKLCIPLGHDIDRCVAAIRGFVTAGGYTYK